MRHLGCSMAGLINPRRPLRSKRPLRLAAVAAFTGALVLGVATSRAWLGTSSAAGRVQGSVARRLGPEVSGDQVVGRRQFVSAAGGVTGGILLMASPEDAQAFRGDRIIVGKSQHTPTIRQLYLKLEGLRDDLVLKVELSNGTRESFRVRPADWNSGIDRKLVGQFVLASDDDSFACKELPPVDGAIVFAARGRCSFAQKAQIAAAAGASALVVYDEKSSKQPLEKQGLTGAQRSKGLANRVAGDVLSGGAWMTPYEKGVTVMAPGEEPKPTIDAVMMNRANGTLILEALKSDQTASILLVDRAEFKDGIDLFLKKDLKKLLREMNSYNLIQRLGKGDKDDPLTRKLNGITKEFEKGVRAKDYGEFRKSFKEWLDNLDPNAAFELNEIY